MGEILSGTGHSQAMLGRSDAAQTQLAEALKLSEKLQNKALTAQILNFQGDRLFYLGDAKGARPLYEQALQTASKTGDKRLELLSKVNLAKTAIAEGRPQSAIEGLKKLAEESDSLGLKYLSVESTVLLGPGARRDEALPAGPAGARARAREERKARPAGAAGAKPLPSRFRAAIHRQRRRGVPAPRRGPPDPRGDPERSEDRRRRETSRPRPDPRRTRADPTGAGRKRAGPRGPALRRSESQDFSRERCRSTFRTTCTGRRTTGPAHAPSRSVFFFGPFPTFLLKAAPSLSPWSSQSCSPSSSPRTR